MRPGALLPSNLFSGKERERGESGRGGEGRMEKEERWEKKKQKRREGNRKGAVGWGRKKNEPGFLVVQP